MIDPVKRFTPEKNFPKYCIMYHSKKYVPVMGQFRLPKNSMAIDAEVGCTEVHKRMVELYFKGVRYFINVGACGAQEGFAEIGELLEVTGVVCKAGMAKFFKYPPVIFNDYKENKLKEALAQCVPSLYYKKEILLSVIDCVEQESEGVAVTAEWLNGNYGKKYGFCKYANIFYVSDIIPGKGKEWVDTLCDEKNRKKFRKDVVSYAIKFIKEVK